MSYDDSGASPGTSAQWQNPIHTFGGISVIWYDGDGFNGSSPVYFRKKFDVNFAPGLSQLTIFVDDDVQLYLNGDLVINDMDGTTTGIIDMNVSQFIVQGQNLIAAKVQDSFGIGEGLGPFSLKVSMVPLPTTEWLGLSLLGFIAAIRQLRKRRHAA